MRLVLLHQTLTGKTNPVLINNESVAYVKPDSKGVTTIGLTGGQLLQVDECIDDAVHQLACDHEANFNLPCSEEIRELRKDEKRNLARIAELESELAALKAKSQEVPPLIYGRFIATIVSCFESKVDDPGGRSHEYLHFANIIVNAVRGFYGSPDLEPYKIK